jgi:hypothetical protein
MTKNLIFLLFPLVAFAQPESYQPIFHITGENPDSYIGYFIANCGDQNSDGADELLLANGYDQVLLFNGGDSMDTIPNMIFSEQYGFVINLTYGENIISQDYGAILISYYDGWSRIYLYDCGAEFDTSCDMYFDNEQYGDGFGGEIAMGDVNGDGYNDIIISAVNFDPGGEYNGKLYIFFGGPEMDNIPDFTITSDYNNFGHLFGSGLACGDVNGDGYADILAMTYSPRKAYLFYGGSELDSVPDWSYQAVSPIYLTDLCIIVPNLNGDQYADIILEPSNSMDSYVFFGGENINNSPDQIISPYVGIFSNVGDLNGDGLDDIVGRNMSNSSIKPLYGSSSGLITGQVIFTPGEPTSLGFCGDVNGDGFNDIAYSSWEPFYYGQMAIYADTTLNSVLTNTKQITSDFKLYQNYPNPFNSSTVLRFELSDASQIDLKIFDISGREVASIINGRWSMGMHTVEWNAEGLPSGTYFIRLTVDGGHLSVVGGQSIVRKVTLIK